MTSKAWSQNPVLGRGAVVVFIEAARHLLFSGGSGYSEEGSICLGSPYFCRILVVQHQLGATNVIYMYWQLFPRLFTTLSLPPEGKQIIFFHPILTQLCCYHLFSFLQPLFYLIFLFCLFLLYIFAIQISELRPILLISDLSIVYDIMTISCMHIFAWFASPLCQQL